MMKKFLLILMVMYSAISFSGENEKTVLSDIIADIENYRNKNITLNLKLKYIDYLFEKIVFYDSENTDIEFDISGKAKKKELSDNLVNIHEGMLYRVKFTVIGAGTLGGLTGDLHEFIPVIFEKIPVEETK